MGRMNSADEKVFEEALSGALADIQSDWENPDALLLACKDALPPDYVPSCRFSRKIQRLLRRSKKRRFGFSGAGKRWIPRLAVVLSVVMLSFAAVDAGIGLKRRIHIDQFPTHTSFLLEAAGQNSLREGDFSWVHLPSYVPRALRCRRSKAAPDRFSSIIGMAKRSCIFPSDIWKLTETPVSRLTRRIPKQNIWM